jgi:S-adenosylmethionine/arginine decarboxylase-like enzyme
MAKTRKAKRSWGYHLIVDAAKCEANAIRSKAQIKAFVKDLVSSINMVAYGEPRIVMFGTGNKKGYTLVQLIETSDITAHFVEETDDAYFDVFSCKPFKPSIAIDIIKKYFKPTKIKTHFIKRQA